MTQPTPEPWSWRRGPTNRWFRALYFAIVFALGLIVLVIVLGILSALVVGFWEGITEG